MNPIMKVSDEQKHSAAHVLAAAVLKVFPDAKIGIGPVTKEGFYYDFDLSKKLTKEDLQKIEGEITALILQDLPFQQKIMSREEAVNYLLMRGQIYKAELVNSIPDTEMSFYSLGDVFTDLCRGPHVASTSALGPVIILRTEETHWNDDVRRPRLQRIYGATFNSLEEFEEYKKLKKEEKNRNYLNIIEKNKLGNILEPKESIYSLGEDLSIIQSRIISQIEFGIGLLSDHSIRTQPIHTNQKELLDDISQIYLLKNRSYRELPFSFAFKSFTEDSNLGKDKKSGQNVDIFGNIIYTSSSSLDIEKTITTILSILNKLKLEGIDAEIEADDISNLLMNQISGILQKKLISHDKIIEKSSDSVRLRFKIKDYFQNKWNVAELEIFKDEKVKVQNQDNAPVSAVAQCFMISSDIILRYLLERYQLNMPIEYKPYHVVCIPINKKFTDNTKQFAEYLARNNISSKVDLRSKSLKSKIRYHELRSTPVIVFIGQKEVTSESVSVRYEGTNIGLVSLDHIVSTINNYLER